MSSLGLTVLSRRVSFDTIHASDLDGPKTRQRVVAQGSALPSWLSSYAPRFGSNQMLIAVAMGKSSIGSRIWVRSIVVFSPPQREPFTCVYVEEMKGTESRARLAAPFQVLRCSTLPEPVRFIEVSEMSAPPPHLRVT